MRFLLVTSFLFFWNIETSNCHSLKWKSDAPDPSPITVGSESWDYVTVRPEAHMFYWLYRTTHKAGYKNRPLILWLQGGPGGSGTGFGNFEEFGPLDANLQPRNTTWLQSASLLFVDNPVGTGFSYVTSNTSFTHNLQEISFDLLFLMKQFVKSFPDFQKTPFYIFSESYGGKMTAGFSAVLYDAISNGEINLNFQGLAMGDSWISPVDFTNSWGPYLYSTSIVSWSGYEKITKAAKVVEDLVKKGDYFNATNYWGKLETVVEEEGHGVNFYNILKWQSDEGKLANTNTESRLGGLYQRHVGVLQQANLDNLMNGQIREKLRIIPNNVKWGGQSGAVFENLAADFMRDVKSTVNDLINKTPLKVVVYSGQLDLICDVLGTEAWFYTMDVAEQFKAMKRSGTKCPESENYCYFSQVYKNLRFYWVLKAGHMVPADNGPGALLMLSDIIG